MALYEELGGRLQAGQIRLLSLSQAPDGDKSESEIHCNLEVVRSDDLESAPPEYFALSYTWGRAADYGKFRDVTDEKKFPVLCNEKHTIYVTENLLGFLRQAQGDPSLCLRRFWVDAVCINQDDSEEKAAQIQLMTKIYSRAKTVLLWLGEDDEYTSTGFAMIRELGTEKYLHKRADEKWVPVGMVFQRTYFSRTWVIQEVILGSDSGEVMVMCGPYSIDWQVLVNASHHITKTELMHTLNRFVAQHHYPGERAQQEKLKSFYGFPTILRAISADRRRGASTWTRTLLHALIRARDFKATQPEDKVYSLLGLVQEHIKDKPRLIPTYQGISKTYIDAAITILTESRGDLLLLSCVEGEKFQLTKGMPSWVPDWSCDSPLGLRRTGYERYWASGDLIQEPVIDAENLTLTLQGIQLDEVTMVGEAKHEVADPGQQFPGWLEILASLPDTYPASSLTDGEESRYEAFWRTLICNTSGDKGEITPKDSPLATSFARWLQARAGQSAQIAELMRSEWFISALSIDSGEQAENFGTVFRHSRHLRLFRTESGYLGLGTECMAVGDSIWVLPGSRIPLIFRQISGDGNNQYKLD
ncbi:hypothetical protein E8E14_008275 [Neopestalotiopsis sp. 37M]|nr:hypothetical protein E8E14_008275 [Neopestalotiopsis sp. 37M]